MKKILILLPVAALLLSCSSNFSNQMMEAVKTGVIQGLNQGLNNPSNGYGGYYGYPSTNNQSSLQQLSPQQINPINVTAQSGDCDSDYANCLYERDLRHQDISICGVMQKQCEANSPKGGPGEIERDYPTVSQENIAACKNNIWAPCVKHDSLGGYRDTGGCDRKYRGCLARFQ